jgi:mannitol/fructose-specific phosphotransferase system IIA component (Ntr-type)
MQAMEVSALCTLQESQEFNHPPVLCVFLVMTLVDVRYSQHHTALTCNAKCFK